MKKIYTHDAAVNIIEMFEDVLVEYDIEVPSPEDDERDEDSGAALYGSVYSDLLDRVEESLIYLLEQKDEESRIIPYIFGGADFLEG